MNKHTKLNTEPQIGPSPRLVSLQQSAREVRSRVIDLCDQLPTLREVSDGYIARVLRLYDGNKSRAARVLGISPLTLANRVKKLKAEA